MHGFKTGGRAMGVPNRATIERQLRAKSGIDLAHETGVLPLDILTAAMRGGPEAANITDRQLQAAIAAAPYIHPRLSAVAVEQAQPGIEFAPDQLTDDELQLLMGLLHRARKPAVQTLVGHATDGV